MKVIFLGAGKMGGAILESLIKAKVAKTSEITVFDTSAERVIQLEKSLKIKGAFSVEAAITGADVVFLAVKPQDLDALLIGVRTAAGLPNSCPRRSIADKNVRTPLFISIAAGKTTAWLEAVLPPKARVVRAMPNLAVSVGQGMTGICAGKNAKKSDMRLALRLFSCCGKALEFPESQFDALTALSGSGPAFYAYFVQAMIDAGASLGLAPETSSVLASQTFLGTALTLSGGNVSTPADFIKAVASAKGTTAAGLEVLEKSALRSTVKKTLSAAAKRGKELSR